MHSKSFVWLSAFVAILFTIGFVPYLAPQAFAAEPAFSLFVANDPDDGDTVLSNGDTLTITFSEATNATNNGAITQAELVANFTDNNIGADAAVDWGTTFSGVWNVDSTILTVTLTDVAGATLSVGTSTIEGRSTTNISSAAEGTNAELLDATTVDRTLTGDFGLFVAVTTGGGSGCNGDCTEPTLGVLSDGRRIVDNGFSYNGKSVDVEYYFTPYPLVTVQVGKQNVAEFKIYDNLGVDNIRHFELAFGLANGESIGMSKAVINWDKTYDGIETVTIDDPENVLDKVKVTTSEGYCSDEMQTKCLIIKVVHTFRAPLDFDILGTNVWDAKRNGWNNYFNHGIEVVGESLNPPKEYEVSEKRQLYHLTETGKTSAVDEFGNSWSLKYGLWEMDYIPTKKIIDGVEQNGIDRNNAWFNIYKQGQELIAKEVLEQYCPLCSDEEFAEINDVFSYELPKRIDKLSDSEILNKLLQESTIAENTLLQIFESLYKNSHY